MHLPSLIIAILIPMTGLSGTENDTARSWLGPDLYYSSTFISICDLGNIHRLHPLQRSVLNIELCADMLQGDLRFFNPDLVTAGQEAVLSSLGYDPAGTRLIWQNRSWRNIRNSRGDFQLIPTLLVGEASSVSTGALSGFTGTGGVVRLEPIDNESEDIVTHLYHRIGYYGFDPVEFVHQRPAGTHTHLIFAGFFPSSGGRFENTGYTGNNLYSKVSYDFDKSTGISASMMQGINRTGIPFTSVKKVLKRFDMDVSFYIKEDENYDVAVALYRTEEIDKYDDFRSFGYMTGLKIDAKISRFWGTIVLNSTRLNLPGSNGIKTTDFEGVSGLSGNLGIVETAFQVGVSSRLPEHLQIQPVLSCKLNTSRYGQFFAVAQRTADHHSLELEYADYRGIRPIDNLQPVWRANPDIPIVGRDVEPTVGYATEVGWRHRVMKGEFIVSGFYKYDQNPVFWIVNGDSIITPETVTDRKTAGCNIGFNLDWRQYRSKINTVFFERNNKYYNELPASFACPELQISWEIGWHDLFFDGDLETDISLGGCFIDEYNSYGPDGWEICGGAYPVDFRVTARIKNFTLFWGLHNLNAYPYYLVPGYKMMHKEEYWGIQWKLYN